MGLGSSTAEHLALRELIESKSVAVWLEAQREAAFDTKSRARAHSMSLEDDLNGAARTKEPNDTIRRTSRDTANPRRLTAG